MVHELGTEPPMCRKIAVIDQLTIANGVVSTKSGQHVSYGELIGGKHFNIAVNSTAKRRSPNQWKVLGKPVPSLDRVALMTGTFEFVHNVRVPGMVHGRVVRPPRIGATLAHVDEKSVQHVPGLIKVVVRNNFVGVVAEKQWQAAQAAKDLKVTWTPGPELPPQKDFYNYMRRQPSGDLTLVDSRDTDGKLKASSRVLQATYSHPYQAHGSIGSSCAVADVEADHATVWSATQSVYPTQHGISALTALPLESVRAPFQPYFTDRVKLTVTGGNISASGKLSLALDRNSKVKAGFVGETSINRFASVDKLASDRFLESGLSRPHRH